MLLHKSAGLVLHKFQKDLERTISELEIDTESRYQTYYMYISDKKVEVLFSKYPISYTWEFFSEGFSGTFKFNVHTGQPEVTLKEFNLVKILSKD